MKKIRKTICLFATILVGALAYQSDVAEARNQSDRDPYGETEAAWNDFLPDGLPLSPFFTVGTFDQYVEDEDGYILYKNLYPELTKKIPSEDYLKVNSIGVEA